jgi:hypothetical protein
MRLFLKLRLITRSGPSSHYAKSINQCCSARMVGAVVPTRWILRLATCPQSRQIQSGPTLHPTQGNNPHILSSSSREQGTTIRRFFSSKKFKFNISTWILMAQKHTDLDPEHWYIYINL